MSDSQHDLVHEFPEFKDKIHELKINNAHFRTLFERYHEVNKHVMGAEHRTELMSQAEEDKLRHERVHLKDELYRILSQG